MTEQLAIFPVRDGLCPHCGTVPPLWTPAAILEAARYFRAQTGRVPGKTDWGKGGNDHPTAHTVYRVFGGFPAMLTAAGLDPNELRGRRVRWTADAIVAAMLNHVAREHKWPTTFDWRWATPEHPHYATVVNMFGSWRRAQFAAGRRSINGNTLLHKTGSVGYA